MHAWPIKQYNKQTLKSYENSHFTVSNILTMLNTLVTMPKYRWFLYRLKQKEMKHYSAVALAHRNHGGCLSTLELATGWYTACNHEVRVKPSLVSRLNQAWAAQECALYAYLYEIAPCAVCQICNWPAGQTTCWCYDWRVSKKLSSLEPKTVKESCFSLDSHYFQLAVHILCHL